MEPDNKPENTPAPATPATPASPTTPTPDSKIDPIALAKELGEKETQLKQLTEFSKNAAPIFQIIQEDPAILKQIDEALKKKAGVADPKPEDKKEDKPATPDPLAVESRQYNVIQAVNQFLKDEGIDKLSPEDSQKVQQMVAKQLGELVDPQGNKTLPQIFNDINLTKLPQFLKNSYNLVKLQMQDSKDPILQSINKDPNMGVLGSMASGDSINPDEIVLTDKEREVAANMGISPEKYLENKKSQAKKREEDQY